MLVKLLQVLRLDEIGKTKHADKIQEAYHEEIDKHRFCQKCNTGTILKQTMMKLLQSIM